MKKTKGIRAVTQATVMAGILFGVTASSTLAASTSEKLGAAKSEMAQTESALNDSKTRIQELASKKDSAEEYLQTLQTELTDLTQELDQLETQTADKEYEYQTIVKELQDATARQATQRVAMGKRIQYMYENSSSNGMLNALFSSESFTEFLNRATNMSELTSYDREMLQEYAEICNTVSEREQQVEEEKENLEDLRTAAETKKDELSDVYSATADTVAELADQLSGEESSAAALLEQVQRQQTVVAALSSQVEEEMAARAAAEAAQAQAAARQAAAVQQSPAPAAEAADVGEAAPSPAPESSPAPASRPFTYSYNGSVLTKTAGVNNGPSGRETYYNMEMSGVVDIMRGMGNTSKYWVREDGAKMLGDYVMVAANLDVHPRGSIVDSSLGKAIVCDTGGFAAHNPNQLDIATAW